MSSGYLQISVLTGADWIDCILPSIMQKSLFSAVTDMVVIFNTRGADSNEPENECGRLLPDSPAPLGGVDRSVSVLKALKDSLFGNLGHGLPALRSLTVLHGLELSEGPVHILPRPHSHNPDTDAYYEFCDRLMDLFRLRREEGIGPKYADLGTGVLDLDEVFGPAGQ